MMIQRTRSGGWPKAAAMAGSAMLTIESSDTTNAPAAGSHRCTRVSWHEPACGPRAVRGTTARMDIKPGATAEVRTTVTPDRTADAMGNTGVLVLATPFLIGLLESAAHAVLAPHLPPGAGTVGTMVEMKLLAATPVGLSVRAKATLLETDGKRFLFGVEAWDDAEKVAEGRHERFLVPDLQKLVARAMKKAGGWCRSGATRASSA